MANGVSNERKHVELNPWGSIINGAASMATALGIVEPLFAIKNYAQLRIGRPPFNALWAGYAANAGSGAPAEGAAFLTHHLGAKILGSDEHHLSSQSNLAISALCGFSAAPINAPVEQGMIRQQLNPKVGFIKHIRRIYSETGIRGVFKGTSVTAGRDAIFNIGVFALFDVFREKLKGKVENQTTRDITAGIGAGVLAGHVSNPLDLCKTLMQGEDSAKYPTFRATARKVIKTHGVKGLFQGAGFRSLSIGGLICLTALFKERYPDFFPQALKAEAPKA